MIGDGITVFVDVIDQRVVPDGAAHTRILGEHGQHGVGIGGLNGIPVGKHLIGVIRPVGEEIICAGEIVRLIAQLPRRDRDVVAQGEGGERASLIGGIGEAVDADDNSGLADVRGHAGEIAELGAALAQQGWQVK